MFDILQRHALFRRFRFPAHFLERIPYRPAGNGIPEHFLRESGNIRRGHSITRQRHNQTLPERLVQRNNLFRRPFRRAQVFQHAIRFLAQVVIMRPADVKLFLRNPVGNPHHGRRANSQTFLPGKFAFSLRTLLAFSVETCYHHYYKT